jgi:hypothetical protein
MSRTASPASRRVRAVPPVEIRSTPNPARVLARSTRPVLSVTLSSARRIGLTELEEELTVALLGFGVESMRRQGAKCVDHSTDYIAGVDEFMLRFAPGVRGEGVRN